MSLDFNCPYCSYIKKVPDSYLLKKLKCPRCLATLTLGVPQPTALTALPLPEEDDTAPSEQTAIEVEKNDSMQECPFCFEVIARSDRECPFCHRMVDPESITAKLGVSFRPQAQRILYLGVASLFCGLGIILGPLVLWLFSKIIQDVRHPKDRDMIYAGVFMGLFGIVSSFVLCIVALL